MTRSAILLALLLAGSLQAQSQKKHRQADPFAGLDTAFTRVLREFHVAGFAVAVVQKDSVVYAHGFGYRDYERKLPVTPHTLFPIGSCTKAFTASLLGQLEAQGKLGLDKPVRDYLPELRFYNETMDNMITLRDMMCHRTGLPRYDYSWYFFPASRDSILRRIRYMEPNAGVREKWQYNNFMFMAQGMVAEKITGQTWEQNITAKIFQPLGMTESVLSIEDMLRQPDYSLGYDVKKDSIINKVDYFRNEHSIAPAGAISSNVLDMSAWLKTWIQGGKYRGKTILPPVYASEAITSQMIITGALPTSEYPDLYFSTYGFGWMLSSYRGHYRAEHGGNIDGFSADASLFPSDSLAIIVLTNQNGSTIPDIIRNLIADRLLHLEYKDWTTIQHDRAEKARKAAKRALASRSSNRKPRTHPSHPLTDYTGLYNNPAFGTFEITLRDDSLFALLGTDTLWLKHYHYDVFDPFQKDRVNGYDTATDAGLKLQFAMDPAGDITGVSMPLEPTLDKPIHFNRVPKTRSLDSALLQKYVGEYDFGPVTAKVYLKGRSLYLFVPGQPEYEMANVGPDKFQLKPLNGYYAQFILDEQGRVTAMMAIQPNGNFKAKKK